MRPVSSGRYLCIDADCVDRNCRRLRLLHIKGFNHGTYCCMRFGLSCCFRHRLEAIPSRSRKGVITPVIGNGAVHGRAFLPSPNSLKCKRIDTEAFPLFSSHKYGNLSELSSTRLKSLYLQPISWQRIRGKYMRCIALNSTWI